MEDDGPGIAERRAREGGSVLLVVNIHCEISHVSAYTGKLEKLRCVSVGVLVGSDRLGLDQAFAQNLEPELSRNISPVGHDDEMRSSLRLSCRWRDVRRYDGAFIEDCFTMNILRMHVVICERTIQRALYIVSTMLSACLGIFTVCEYIEHNDNVRAPLPSF